MVLKFRTSIFPPPLPQKGFPSGLLNDGGDLLVYVKNGVSCYRSSDLELDTLECVWVEVKPTNSKSFLVDHLYKSPKSNVQWNDFFEESIENVLSLELETYILGDVNRDLLNENIMNPWLEYTVQNLLV